MAKVKAVVLNKMGKDGTTNIKIRLTHKKSIEIGTPWYIPPKYMGIDGIIKTSYPGSAALNKSINALLFKFNRVIQDLGPEIRNMSARDVANRLINYEVSEDFIKYMKARILTLKREKRFSYAGTYEATLALIIEFAEKDSLSFREVNPDFIDRFERHLLFSRKVNTVRIYLNNIKAVFNHAIDNKFVSADLFPFRHKKIVSEEPEKRSIGIDAIKKLYNLQLSPERTRARDLFFLSFFLRGINFKDLLFLTPKNVQDGRIVYKRYKTNKNVSVKITPVSEALLAKYEGERYLLKFLEDYKYKNVLVGYKNIVKSTNTLLKKIVKQNKLGIVITTYSARHSLATLMYEAGVSESTISEALGHTTGQKVTETYIRRNYNRVDEANDLIISLVVS